MAYLFRVIIGIKNNKFLTFSISIHPFTGKETFITEDKYQIPIGLIHRIKNGAAIVTVSATDHTIVCLKTAVICHGSKFFLTCDTCRTNPTFLDMSTLCTNLKSKLLKNSLLMLFVQKSTLSALHRKSNLSIVTVTDLVVGEAEKFCGRVCHYEPC